MLGGEEERGGGCSHEGIVVCSNRCGSLWFLFFFSIARLGAHSVLVYRFRVEGGEGGIELMIVMIGCMSVSFLVLISLALSS